MNNILLNHWYNSLEPFPVNIKIANYIFNKLTLAYSQPHRYYHTIKHIHAVLNTIDVLKSYIQDLSTIKLAAWFHDIIYDTHAQDNEEKSAEYAGEMLNILRLPNDRIAKVKKLILATKHHQADDIDTQVLLDADLAIFATTPREYQEYTQSIRQEYAWVNNTEYIQARSKVLKSFLQRPSIYFTPLMLESSEQIARFNIERELITELAKTEN